MHIKCALYAALACPYMRKEAQEAADSGGWFGFTLADGFLYDDGDESYEGEFVVEKSVVRVMDVAYADFVRYARSLRDNPRFADLPFAADGALTAPIASI